MSVRPPALAGVKVFDLSQGIAGPYCTMLMAAQGADVIKVEPIEGDWIRRSSNLVRGQAPAALAVNAGKRSISFDLKQPSERGLAIRIAASCDIIVESFRPGVVEKFGLDAASMQALRPDLVYCSITGFGQMGSLSARPVIDHIAQAYSGWMSVNADASGLPQRTRNVVLADQITGLYAYQAVSSALIRTLRFGGGERLDVTLIGAMAAFLAPRITSHILSEGRAGNAEFMPPTGDYSTLDGILVVAVQKAADVERLFALVGRSDLLLDHRFSTPKARRTNAEALRNELGQTFQTKTALDWEKQLADMNVMVCAARDMSGFLASQQSDGLALVDTVTLPEFGDCPLVRIPGAPGWDGRTRVPGAPRVGEHTGQILQEVGLTPEEIDSHLRGAS